MNLYEFQAKEMLREYDIKIPQGQLVHTSMEALNASKKIGFPVMIKAQVLEGGRGKVGLIRSADKESEVLKEIEDLTCRTDKFRNIKKMLVEERICLKEEYYLGITIDELAAKPVLIFGTTGGVDIEEISTEQPESIFKLMIDNWEEILQRQVGDFIARIPIGKETFETLILICKRLRKMFLEKDCLLAEINPLGVSGEGDLIALDAKIIVDDNALFRQPDIKEMEGESSDIPLENEANKKGFSYVKLNGDIGIISHGAGLGMLVVDMIENAGGRAANFLDIKGHEREKNRIQEIRVKNEMDIVLSDDRVKAILFNVFGGLTRCDEVALGIRAYVEKHQVGIPIIVRLSGTGSEKVNEILKDLNVILVEDLDEAISKVVQIQKGNKEYVHTH